MAAARLVDGIVIDDGDVTGWTSERLTVAIPLLLIAAFLTVVAGVGVTVLILRTIDGEPPAPDTRGEIRSGWSAVVVLVVGVLSVAGVSCCSWCSSCPSASWP